MTEAAYCLECVAIYQHFKNTEEALLVLPPTQKSGHQPR